MNEKVNRLVVITQPDFLPWLGSFDKFIKSDVFVFLDDVTNRVSDGIWTKRVKILVNGTEKWLSVPLKKTAVEFTLINEMEIDQRSNFTKKHLLTIENNYRRAPFFKEALRFIENFYNNKSPKIAVRNASFFMDIMDAMGIKREVHFSSDMGLKSKRNELLVDIVKRVDGDGYLYGKGSLSYLDFELWNQNNISLIAQNFIHPEYPQINSTDFIPGLSIIDALCNVGIDETKRLFKSAT